MSIEKSREIRQWIYLLLEGGLAIATVVGIVDNMFNVKVSARNLRTKANEFVTNFKEKQEVRHESEREHLKEKAERMGYKTLHYSEEKWKSVKDHFRLLQLTNGMQSQDGYYRMDCYQGETYYIMIG